MSKIIDANGTEYTETKGLISLYDKAHTPENRFINDFLEENQQKISDNTAQTLEGKITYTELSPKKGKREVQGVPQSQTAAHSRHQEEEETVKTKQAQIEQTYEKHQD